jgi:hypothetical protein
MTLDQWLLILLIVATFLGAILGPSLAIIIDAKIKKPAPKTLRKRLADTLYRHYGKVILAASVYSGAALAFAVYVFPVVTRLSVIMIALAVSSLLTYAIVFVSDRNLRSVRRRLRELEKRTTL